MPDALLRRAKTVMASREVTFRALVIDALERSLDEKQPQFVLRDASVGYAAQPHEARWPADVNRAIDELRESKEHS